MELLRSNVEFSKRLFLDRLTVDAQPLLQADPNNYDEGPGDDYEYGGYYDAFDFGIGADCSGANGIEIGAALFGANNMQWERLFDTETFGSWAAPLGFRQTNAADLLNNPYPIKVWIEHGGGGPNSHMMCMIDGWQMESNGDCGTSTMGHGGTSLTDPIWNDWWVYDGPITEDTTYRTPTQYPKGLDYAGGTISGATLRAAGIAFVCRYLSDGGPGLPSKQLQPGEFQDLMNNGIGVVFNWETTSNFILSDDGATDARAALAYIQTLPGMSGVGNPCVYFSADWDATEGDQDKINNFCRAASSVLGLSQTRLYGDYYVCKRAMDAGVIGGFWQTEAWSGFGEDQQPHIDSRVSIVQRNNVGYVTVGGVQCDFNEAHMDDIGAWGTQIITPTPVPVVSTPGPVDPFLAWMDGASNTDLLKYIAAQIGPGDPAWASKGMTVRDLLWSYKPLWDQQSTVIKQLAAQVPVPKGSK